MGKQMNSFNRALAAFAVAAWLAPVVCGQTDLPPLQTSSKVAQATSSSFEVATVKPVEHGPNMPRFLKLEGTNRFIARDYNLRLLIAAAYNTNSKAISGGPGWIDSDYYDISAVTPGPVRPTRDDQMAMLRTLLEDRFQLTFHREKKEFPIYALGVAKSGPKLRTTNLTPNDPSIVGPAVVYPQRVVLPARNATMGDFTSLLQRAVLDRPVVDMTGLTDRYDFTLEWAPYQTQFGGDLPNPTDTQIPPLFTAVQEQLGLRLEARKGPVSAIVIDQANHPSPN